MVCHASSVFGASSGILPSSWWSRWQSTWHPIESMTYLRGARGHSNGLWCKVNNRKRSYLWVTLCGRGPSFSLMVYWLRSVLNPWAFWTCLCQSSLDLSPQCKFILSCIAVTPSFERQRRGAGFMMCHCQQGCLRLCELLWITMQAILIALSEK